MNIAVCASSFLSAAEARKKYIAEILSVLAAQMSEHRFLIITEKNGDDRVILPSNIEIIETGSSGRSKWLKKYWWGIILPGSLKKIKADILISFDDRCSQSLVIPQILVTNEGEKINIRCIHKASVISTCSLWYKNEWVRKYGVLGEKIEIVNPSVNENYKPLSATEREMVKSGYSDNKEYFLYLSRNIQPDTFISLLKSFSWFKKRQQSRMKLLLMSAPDKKYLESLSTYKYRDDIVIMENASQQDEAALIGSSYAVFISPDDQQPVFNLLKAWQSAVPVIATENSPVKETASDAALYADHLAEKDWGEKMMRVYTDENLRSQLIGKGKTKVTKFTIQQSALQLQRCIQKVIK